MTTQTALMVDSAQAVDAALLGSISTWIGVGTPPYAWGRYLGDGGNPAVIKPLTQGEAAFLHQSGVRILPVYNDVVASRMQAVREGTRCAQEAVAQAQALGVPPGTCIVADVEHGWPLNLAWLQDWCQGITAAGYQPGIYCILTDHYVRSVIDGAVKSPKCSGLIVWDAHWLTAGSWRDRHKKPSGGDRLSPPAWQEPTGERVGAWQFAGGSGPGQVVDCSLIVTAGPTAPVLWSADAQPVPAQPSPASADLSPILAEVSALRRAVTSELSRIEAALEAAIKGGD